MGYIVVSVYIRAIGFSHDGTLRVWWIPGEYNLEYLFTKTTITVNMRHSMV